MMGWRSKRLLVSMQAARRRRVRKGHSFYEETRAMVMMTVGKGRLIYSKLPEALYIVFSSCLPLCLQLSGKMWNRTSFSTNEQKDAGRFMDDACSQRFDMRCRLAASLLFSNYSIGATSYPCPNTTVCKRHGRACACVIIVSIVFALSRRSENQKERNTYLCKFPILAVCPPFSRSLSRPPSHRAFSPPWPCSPLTLFIRDFVW